MNNTNKGAAFIEEITKFLTFLQNLWGVLAGMSVLFPISSALMNVIPIEEYDYDGGLAFSSSELLTGVATLISLFIILWTYGQRQEFKAHMEMYTIRRQAIFSFAFGFLALFIYLLGYSLAMGDFYVILFGWESVEVILCYILNDIILLFSYSAFFALMTRAFILLGMIEFFKRED